MAAHNTEQVGLGRRILAWTIKLALWVLFLWWVGIWMANATRKGQDADYGVQPRLSNNVMGVYTWWFVIFCVPVFLMALLAPLYLQWKTPPVYQKLENTGKHRAGFWHYPMWKFSWGLFGVLTAAELLVLALTLVFFTFVIVYYIETSFEYIREEETQKYIEDYDYEVWQFKISYIGFYFGYIGFIPMTLLFIPVSRTSPFLRLLNIPFEYAVKYHKWMGVITVFCELIHGVFYSVYFGSVHQIYWLKYWPKNGISYLAGVIALVAGILICITSIPLIRSKWFEFFFYSHHLYVIWILFTAFHIGEDLFYVVWAGVFLFAVDRILRFIQSRKQAGLLSVRNLPGDTIELSFAKHPSLQYGAASYVFVQIPSIARWQWHPFTMASSSLVDKDRVIILVKKVGKWTKGLELLLSAPGVQPIEDSPSKSPSKSRCPFASAIEGPYGHESSGYFLRYESLVFVAGGSGVAPFISILKDLMYRHNKNQPCLPKDIKLIWAVRKEDELNILEYMNFPETPGKGFHITVQGYVTRQKGPDLEAHSGDLPSIPASHHAMATLKPLCPEFGKDSNYGAFAVVLASLAGFFFVWGLLGHFYLDVGTASYESGTYPTSARVVFNFAAMFFAIAVFGGGLIFIWSHFGRPAIYRPPSNIQPIEHEMGGIDSPRRQFIRAENVAYRGRPNLAEIFDDEAKRLAGEKVGVLVCGPPGMQDDVAAVCAKHSSLLRKRSVAFDFHSATFEF